ncbi:hypothetical protein FXO37_18428 [Capsicum annuum]|nr:hypothetical protein FXO37_18428 [Capsicum annuum]
MISGIIFIMGINKSVIYVDYDEHVQVLLEHAGHQAHIGCWIIAAFAKYLSEGLGIPSSDIDAQYHCLRYPTLLCKYGSLKALSGYFSENDDPPRPRSSFIATAKDRVLTVE